MKKLTIRIAGAVMAVIFAAGVGTAALASGEPPRDGGHPVSQQTVPQQQDRQTAPPDAPRQQDQQSGGGQDMARPDDSAAPSGEIAPQFDGESRKNAGGPAVLSEGDENETPADAPGRTPSGESGEPGDELPEKPADAPEGELSGEPGASGRMRGEASGEPSGEPDANGQPDEERPAADGTQEPREQRSRGGFTENIRTFFEDLFRQFMNLLGFSGSTAQQPAEPPQGGSEPAGDASGEPGESSGEPGEASNEPGASGEMGGGSSGEPTDYTAANTLTEDSAGASYTSSNGDENAVLVSGDTVTVTDVTVTKTGSSSGESADFYGVNAGVLAKDGATLTIENAEITTDGTHANGVFSYGSGTTVNISDSTITTSAANSGGIMTTGGASLNAVNLTVSTSGNSSAAIRSDRGGGTVTVSEGSYAASGVGSPAIYSTADISVSDAALTSTSSEAVVIEGGNSVTLVNDTVSGNNARLNGQSTVKTNVLIYQSMSGDAAEGNSTFTMTGGSMTAGTGAMFHVTNVTTEINLSGVEFTYAPDSGVFLDASADSWGTAGRNGGNVTLNLDAQDITGVITTDSVSTVAVNMTNGSTWTLTGDSYITSLTGDTSGIDLNGYTLYVGGAAYTA